MQDTENVKPGSKEYGKCQRMQEITFIQPSRLSFGGGVSSSCPQDLVAQGVKRVLVLCDPHVRESAGDLIAGFDRADLAFTVCSKVQPEPTIEALETALAEARAFGPDGVVGIGGGSTLDMAKLIAALCDGQQTIGECFGIGKVASRNIVLVAIPTTAGTGSEVTPIAVIADEAAQLKKGIVSSHLVPDAVYVDPDLTLELPAAVTAATGMDALTHCIEVYTNKHGHPMVDLYAIEGIRLIGANLVLAVENGSDRRARAAMSRASLYGGLGLGPVNTAAVHALAYPLGGEFHISHGVANAVLLPHVLRFNQPAVPERHARIAQALGVPEESPLADHVQRLSARVGVPQRLRDLGIVEEAVSPMARSAMQVTRLLNNNPREITVQDAEEIYRAAF